MLLIGNIYAFGDQPIPQHLRAIAEEIRERGEINDAGPPDTEAARADELGDYLDQIANKLETL